MRRYAEFSVIGGAFRVNGDKAVRAFVMNYSRSEPPVRIAAVTLRRRKDERF